MPACLLSNTGKSSLELVGAERARAGQHAQDVGRKLQQAGQGLGEGGRWRRETLTAGLLGLSPRQHGPMDTVSLSRQNVRISLGSCETRTCNPLTHHVQAAQPGCVDRGLYGLLDGGALPVPDCSPA